MATYGIGTINRTRLCKYETPSITNDNGRWVYWSSRFVKITYVFRNGILEDGRGL